MGSGSEFGNPPGTKTAPEAVINRTKPKIPDSELAQKVGSMTESRPHKEEEKAPS